VPSMIAEEYYNIPLVYCSHSMSYISHSIVEICMTNMLCECPGTSTQVCGFIADSLPVMLPVLDPTMHAMNL